MKRTVVRWVSAWVAKTIATQAKETGLSFYPEKDETTTEEITITYDDEQPEEKCPCVASYCCRPVDGEHCQCCPVNAKNLPCLSDFHKPPAAGTRERAIEGFVDSDDLAKFPISYPLEVYPNTDDERDRSVTLIIHELAPEPTLYEAVEQHYANALPHDILAAFNRERAAREREGR